MGGNTERSTEGSAAKEKDVNEWLQIVIDVLASEYSWTKETIFSMFPQEIEILIARIRARQEQNEDAEFLRMIIAARAPNTEDGGQMLINTINAKYKRLDTQTVTAESIKREMAIARSVLGR